MTRGRRTLSMTKPREGGRSATTRWSMNNADITKRRAEALPKGLSSSPVFAASAKNAKKGGWPKGRPRKVP